MAERRPQAGFRVKDLRLEGGTREKEKDACVFPEKAQELRAILAKPQKYFRKTKPLCLIIEKKEKKEIGKPCQFLRKGLFG